MSAASEARAMLAGQLLAGLAGAQRMIQIAQQSHALMTDDDQRRLCEAFDTIAGIEQRTWAEWSKR